MPKEDEKKVPTIEELQKQIDEINTTHQTEIAKLKEEINQKDLKIAQLSLGGVAKKETKEEKEEPVEFDFDF